MQPTHAEGEKVLAPLRVEKFEVGHNLSITSDTLGPGQCAVGVQAAACGVDDRVTIGTSPWLMKDYRTWSAGVRYLIDEDNDGRWILQESYFKSFYRREIAVNPDHDYQMEALWSMLVRTIKFDENYKLHINFHVNYYYDDKMPFSLRRPYTSRSPWQLNLTTLQEMNLVHDWYAFIEVGALDFTQAPIHAHGGFSVGKRMGRLSFHLGFSASGTVDGFFSPNHRIDYQQDLRWHSIEGYNIDLDPELIKYDFAIHPEFALQYLF